METCPWPFHGGTPSGQWNICTVGLISWTFTDRDYSFWILWLYSNLFHSLGVCLATPGIPFLSLEGSCTTHACMLVVSPSSNVSLDICQYHWVKFRLPIMNQYKSLKVSESTGTKY